MFAVTKGHSFATYSSMLLLVLRAVSHIPLLWYGFMGQAVTHRHQATPSTDALLIAACLQINGSYFHAPDTGPVTLLKARHANYEQMVIRMLPNFPSNTVLGGAEAIAGIAMLPQQNNTISLPFGEHLLK